MNPRINCCRLCLAPEEECIPIFNNFAADRQRLDQKIYLCVQLKVHEKDFLSPMICHACISYLNSWQSFKNRCDAAEKKQKTWIDSNNQNDNTDRTTVFQQLKELCPGVTIKSISPKLTSGNRIREKLVENGERINTSLQDDERTIKNEPNEVGDDNEERSVDMELDPSQFLLQSQNEEDYDDYNEAHPDGGPSLLASLGLQQINATQSLGNMSENENGDEDTESLHRQTMATCSICDMTFSNRANARRHERNIHGLRQNPVNPLSAQVPKSMLGYREQSTSSRSDNYTTISATSTGIPSIDLKHKLKMKLKSQRENFDYSNPSKHRHLITPNRLAFILRNQDFLEQAQHMKCKCCNKTYPSYKYFMGHMRKKYQNLPRNVCFKCLKQFSSKGQFIGHLKRKSCINLYAIVMSDNSIPKTAPSNGNSGAPGTKEVISNKSYGCKLCDKEFKPKIKLKQHVLETHPEVQLSKEMPEASCAFCQKVFDDKILRRKHYNNLDCLMFIICCSCRERFDNHTTYVDHVYQYHLPAQAAGQDEYGYDLFDQDGNSSSHLRNPQNCPVCNKQYNNYYNVLRHMESKHPNQLPQIYQCTKCPEGFPRQSELRDHLLNAHGETAIRQQKISQFIQSVDPSTSNFSCKECGQSFMHLYELAKHQNTEHSKFSCPECEFQTDSNEIFTVHYIAEHPNHSSSNSKVQLYSCRQCSNTYNSIDSLQQHMQTHHNLTSDNKISANTNGCKESQVASQSSCPSRAEESVGSVGQGIVDNGPSDLPSISKTLNCGLCGFVLTDIEALRQHMTKIHGMDKKFFYCNQCPAKFMNDKGLRVHLFRVHGVRDDSVPLTPGSSLLKPLQQQMATHGRSVPGREFEGKDEKGESANECVVCHTVYKSSDQLKEHMQAVHPDTNKITNTENYARTTSTLITPHQPPLWFQCRYCSESFNTSKRLTIHMNTHEEYDKSDHSCKDCGGTYSTKKSLWVHRYKKHPKIPDASPCDICPRVFFDKTELFYHMAQAHVRGIVCDSKSNGNGKEFPEMHCASDALFSMLDAEVINRKEQPSSLKPDEVIYQCDMCPKNFQILNALQVHRGWHFRSPDGRKVRNPNDIWQPDQLPPSKVKRLSQSQRTPSVLSPSATPSTESLEKYTPICPYCPSTFFNENSLRQHIIEVHKPNDNRNVPSKDSKPSSVDKVLECRICALSFNTITECIEHKLQHVRLRKPSPNDDWCCEVCKRIFPGKDFLLQHMLSHLKNKESDRAGDGVTLAKTELTKLAVDENSSANITEIVCQASEETNKSEICIKQEKDVDMKEQSITLGKNDYNFHVKEEDPEDEDVQIDKMVEEEYVDDEDDDGDYDTNDEEDSEHDAEEEVNSKPLERYSCELCQVNFSTPSALRLHVSEHFVNGGLGDTVLYTQQSTHHRTSTDSSSSDNSSNSNSSSSSENSSSDIAKRKV